MRKYTILLIMSFLLLACDKGNNSETDRNEYYVRYISDRAVGMAYYTDADGEIVTIRNVPQGYFERTVGPVYKGFVCSFTMDRGTGICDLPVRIEVKENDAPFVVKAEGVYRVSYTID